MKKELTLGIAALSVAALLSYPAGGKKQNSGVDGAMLFAQHCSKCHVGGGNVVKESHPIAGSKQLATLAIFKAYLSSPPGHMPYYEQIVEKKTALESLYKYCKKLKVKPVKQAFGSADGGKG